MQLAVRGHGIEGYLFSTKTQSTEFLESQDEDGNAFRIITLEYQQWIRED